jgi:hypothetical protein
MGLEQSVPEFPKEDPVILAQMLSAKGFLNRAGENNCFINVIIQIGFCYIYSFFSSLKSHSFEKWRFYKIFSS